MLSATKQQALQYKACDTQTVTVSYQVSLYVTSINWYGNESAGSVYNTAEENYCIFSLIQMY